MGHLFVINGDITRLACDAWLLPTDDELNISKSFFSAVGLPGPGRLPGGEWQGRRVKPFDERSRRGPSVWLGDVGRAGQSPGWYAQCGIDFVRAASEEFRDLRDREHRPPLLAVNVLGSGHGGMAAHKGAVHEVLLPALEQAAQESRADVAYVTWDRRAYSAAQRVRRNRVEQALQGDLARLWDFGEDSTALIAGAKHLAAQIKIDNLVLFIGAGVSAEVGLPVWQELIDELALRAGYLESQLERLHKFDMRDQAALISKRLQSRGVKLREVVGARFASESYSLTHALLTSLNIREAVTTNYDQLFEAAASTGDPRHLAVLPYQAVKPGHRWLLKIHGSIDHEDSIVLTRSEYLGVAARHEALFGIVQAMLLTRHMLFVGYSLSDEDFHAVVQDVRSARDGVEAVEKLGTALTLSADPIFKELWEDDLDILAMTPDVPNGPPEKAAAARRLQIFLDLVGYEAADLDAHLLDDTYTDMLDGDERHLQETLRELAQQADTAGPSPGWQRVRQLLHDFGGDSH